MNENPRDSLVFGRVLGGVSRTRVRERIRRVEDIEHWPDSGYHKLEPFPAWLHWTYFPQESVGEALRGRRNEPVLPDYRGEVAGAPECCESGGGAGAAGDGILREWEAGGGA